MPTEVQQIITNPESLLLKIADAIHTFEVHGVRNGELRMGFSPLVERIIFEELVKGQTMGLASGVEGGSIKSLYGVACDSFWPWNKIVMYGKHSYLNNGWIIEIAVEHPAKEAFEMKPARFPADESVRDQYKDLSLDELKKAICGFFDRDGSIGIEQLGPKIEENGKD